MSRGIYGSEPKTPQNMLIVNGTPVPAPSIGLSGGAIAGIVIGGLIGALLVIWLTKLLTLYLFEVLPDNAAPVSVDSAADNTCCDMGCNYINLAIIKSWCPEAYKKSQNRSLYNRNTNETLLGPIGGSNGML